MILGCPSCLWTVERPNRGRAAAALRWHRARRHGAEPPRPPTDPVPSRSLPAGRVRA